jgi:hypothetical protein
MSGSARSEGGKVKAGAGRGVSPGLHKRSAEGRGYARRSPKGCLDGARGEAP